jgi:hypothetical protein
MKKHFILLFSLLIIMFSSSKTFSQIEYCYDWEAYVYGYSELLHNNQALLVSGLAGTEIIVYDWTPPYCDHDFNAWVYSELANSSGVLSYGRLESNGWQIHGQHPVLNAQYRTYCVTSAHGLVDYWSYDDGKIIRFFTDEYTAFFTQDCYAFTPPPPPTPTPTPTPTPIVTSVAFEQIAPSSEPISPNPAVVPHNPGIGLRIFPDDDFPNDPADHQRIRVIATLSQPIQNVQVYFRNFDLDDPATDATIDPNGTTGDDNNGNPRAGTLSACLPTANGCSALTNASGIATVEFTVTRQPGDNFAIAAGVIPAEVGAVTMNGIDLINGSGQVIPTSCSTEPVCRSQMLTVWRRLHIEVDSMRESDGNYVLGTIPDERTIPAGRQATLEVNPSPAQQLEVNRFIGGRLVVGNSLSVISNTADTVTVQNNTRRTIYIPAVAQFQLYDDDDFNDNDGTNLDGDTGENISSPDLALLTANSDDINTNVFASAYARPVYDIIDPRDDSIFAPNVLSDNANDIRPLFVDWDSRNTNADDEFWSVYLLGSYQHTLIEDNDPATELGTYGIVDEITTVTGDGEGSGALIFLELHRPREIPGYTPIPTDVNSMAVTVAHEVGHLFSCRHADGGLMGNTPAGVPVSNQLSPTMIRRVRVLMHP